MTSTTLNLESILQPDRKATRIAEKWIEWDNSRQQAKNLWEEVRRYVYATDTSKTSNSTLPWKNKTTIPKLCQIRDNLYSNYTATMFPQRKSLIWDANESDSDSMAKRDSITNYMQWSMDQPSFKHEMDKVILDYIDYGNCFMTVEWVDERVGTDAKTTAGYIGPALRRISPLDIVFNPTAEDFRSSPKIVRSLISKGELRKMLEKLSQDEMTEEYEKMWDYFKEIRSISHQFTGEFIQRDALYQIEGFNNFRSYLDSDTIEVLTFYGDLYDEDNDTLYENHVITVVDRHKLIGCKPNPSFFSKPPIFHVAWRKRPDNIWGMGPLDNLVGMQYRIDHVENMKADIYDLVTFPVQKIKGFVEDYTWQPGEKIFVSEEGDVEMVVPDVQALQANFEIQNLERLMEEMAGAPREAMGFRTPGEKTKYEVQSLENASARIFQNKIKQFEEQGEEPVLNAMLELARRNLISSTTIKIFNDEFNAAIFKTLTPEDITGIGRIKPVAARHFAEQAQLVQNLTSLTQSNLWPTVQPHFSSIKLAKILEEIFNLRQYRVVMPNIALFEQAEAQKMINTLQEQIGTHAMTATGQGEDFDMSAMDSMMLQGQMEQQAPQEGV